MQEYKKLAEFFFISCLLSWIRVPPVFFF